MRRGDGEKEVMPSTGEGMGETVPKMAMGMGEAVPATGIGGKWNGGMLDRPFGEQVDVTLIVRWAGWG